MTIEYESPFVICSALKEEYLELLAKDMLKVVEKTLASNTGEYDDSYTFETCLFGRMRQLFLRLHSDKGRPEIRLASQSMDYVPRISNIPVRVFKDDPHSPKKMKIFYQNGCEQQQLSLLFEEDEFDSAGSLAWRLLIEAPATVHNAGNELEDIEDDYHVVLVGYHPISKTIVSMWRSTSVVNTPIHSVDDILPEEKRVERRLGALRPLDTGVSVEERDE